MSAWPRPCTDFARLSPWTTCPSSWPCTRPTNSWSAPSGHNVRGVPQPDVPWTLDSLQHRRDHLRLISRALRAILLLVRPHWADGGVGAVPMKEAEIKLRRRAGGNTFHPYYLILPHWAGPVEVLEGDVEIEKRPDLICCSGWAMRAVVMPRLRRRTMPKTLDVFELTFLHWTSVKENCDSQNWTNHLHLHIYMVQPRPPTPPGLSYPLALTSTARNLSFLRSYTSTIIDPPPILPPSFVHSAGGQ